MTNATPLENITKNDPVNHPTHYTNHPAKCKCGEPIECIQITEHMGFNLGNTVKYVWRCDLKKDAIEDLKKARWYLDREIERREKVASELSATKYSHPASGNSIVFNMPLIDNPANVAIVASDVLSKTTKAGAHVG
ncbi:hypothetical protein SEA_ATUIN_163 [Arthrobacter phage Atuin]|nr:hypothetical protein SEA_ATUIN_262 [Arthrobacter phage Atuin]